MAPPAPFVGRDSELARLGVAVAQARDGQPVVSVVEGDAGLGKSRLVAEAIAAHRLPTDLVTVGHGVELTGGELPYGTVAETLRSLVRNPGADAVRTAAGGYADALSALHTPLRDPAGTVALDRLRLLPAYVTTLEGLGVGRLVWLVIEDLHWVDASSRGALAYLARAAAGCQLLVVLTCRTHNPGVDAAVADLVESLARSVNQLIGLWGSSRAAGPRPDAVASGDTTRVAHMPMAGARVRTSTKKRRKTWAPRVRVRRLSERRGRVLLAIPARAPGRRRSHRCSGRSPRPGGRSCPASRRAADRVPGQRAGRGEGDRGEHGAGGRAARTGPPRGKALGKGTGDGQTGAVHDRRAGPAGHRAFIASPTPTPGTTRVAATTTPTARREDRRPCSPNWQPARPARSPPTELVVLRGAGHGPALDRVAARCYYA